MNLIFLYFSVKKLVVILISFTFTLIIFFTIFFELVNL
uniref:Uncharacterized protein n=1 Tax=Polysiphonia elongata TaxID=159753 RepID=A0A1Z1MBR7_9FLOR|nr:hypothetical protein [Polysiphonia elongata]ARW63399.1 hypothetical protein [Polysiphonia elongata]